MRPRFARWSWVIGLEVISAVDLVVVMIGEGDGVRGSEIGLGELEILKNDDNGGCTVFCLLFVFFSLVCLILASFSVILLWC